MSTEDDFIDFSHQSACFRRERKGHQNVIAERQQFFQTCGFKEFIDERVAVGSFTVAPEGSDLHAEYLRSRGRCAANLSITDYSQSAPLE
jgi:hypothetical protein